MRMDLWDILSMHSYKRMMFHMINVMFDKNNYLCLNESYQKTRKNMKETIAKMNEVMTSLQAELAKAAEFRKQSIAELK